MDQMAIDATPYEDWLISLRREFHRRPEPAWCEFDTTARIVEELEECSVDEILLGRDIHDSNARDGLPSAAELEQWREQARESIEARGGRVDLLEAMEGGYTGAIAVLERGEGPTVGLRVDIDALPRDESDHPDHVPAAEGFRSERDGYMHACGHDAHITIGLGVLRAIADSDFAGTLKVLFQPAEELVSGGRPIAKSGHFDDVDALFVVHVGLDHPTGEIVAGISEFLAVSHLDVTFEGTPAHAGAHPQAGSNAVQAMAAAVANLYGIARHTDGATRVNAGEVGGGSASNIIPESAYIHGEVRGETTELMEYMRERATTVIESAADMHDCSVAIDYGAEAPSGQSDEALMDLVERSARQNDRVESSRRFGTLGGSEDATYLMRRVQERGGLATYAVVGTDHPGGHHTATFDVDERSLLVGVEVLTEAILAFDPSIIGDVNE